MSIITRDKATIGLKDETIFGWNHPRVTYKEHFFNCVMFENEDPNVIYKAHFEKAGLFAEFNYGMFNSIIVVNDASGGTIPLPYDTNLISQNSIYNNGKIGIDLHTGAENKWLGTVPYVTPNDPGDGDGGANLGQNFPRLSLAQVNGAAWMLEWDGHIQFCRNRPASACSRRRGLTIAGWERPS